MTQTPPGAPNNAALSSLYALSSSLAIVLAAWLMLKSWSDPIYPVLEPYLRQMLAGGFVRFLWIGEIVAGIATFAVIVAGARMVLMLVLTGVYTWIYSWFVR